ncbi:MAG: carbon-nitrogen hydrolase family protein, partial [Candidatus Latescibacteria bacterium]|nr:carbon-nitrogen hydrolase family protein [Candidatus Latescibacterota bacterium]
MGKKRTVRVGLIKAVPKKWDLEANWATFERLAVSAKERGSQIICTPETFLDGYVTA